MFVEIGGQVHLDDPAIQAMVLRLRPYDDQQLLERYLEALATSVPVEQTLLPLVGSIQAQHLTSQVSLAYDWVPSTGRFASAVDTGLPAVLAGADDVGGAGDRRRAAMGHGHPHAAAGGRGIRSTCSPSPTARRPPRPGSARAGCTPCRCRPTARTWPASSCGSRQPARPMIGHGAALEHSVWLAALGFERRHSEQLLLHAALHDTLTGIPNRSHFFGELQRIEHPDPDDDRGRCAVLFADLDGFKEINDTHGHGVGDQVLAVIARRLVGAVRPGDVVARVGGDEFAVLCTDLDADGEATAVADRLIEVVSQPIGVGEITARVGLSIGVAFHDPASEVEERLVDAADHALYRAKQAGKGQWVVAHRE